MVVMVRRGPPVARLGLRLRMGEGGAELLVVRVFRLWLSLERKVSGMIRSLKLRSYRGKSFCCMWISLLLKRTQLSCL